MKGCSTEANDCLIHEHLVDWPFTCVCKWVAEQSTFCDEAVLLPGSMDLFPLTHAGWKYHALACLEHACSFSSADISCPTDCHCAPPTGPRVSVPGAAILPASSLNFSLTGSHVLLPTCCTETPWSCRWCLLPPPAVTLLLRQVLQTEDVFPAGML